MAEPAWGRGGPSEESSRFRLPAEGPRGSVAGPTRFQVVVLEHLLSTYCMHGTGSGIREPGSALYGMTTNSVSLDLTSSTVTWGQ